MQRHPFHLVKPSFWPFFTSLSFFFFALSFVGYMHFFCSFFVFFMFFLSLLLCFLFWFMDVIFESTYQGYHTRAVQRGLRIGVILFIVSEVMFFFAFFWAFFHSSLSPSIQIGCVWPPAGIVPFSPWRIPLLNTIVLLVSGMAITAAHYYLILGDGDDVYELYLYTLGLAVLFTLLQLYEYRYAPFDISDGIYGSTFFMTTGLHGFHVLAGTIAIFISFLRTCFFDHFTREHHIGFESAVWYWHFVDVVWLFLFVAVYWWGGALVFFSKNVIEFFECVLLNLIFFFPLLATLLYFIQPHRT